MLGLSLFYSMNSDMIRQIYIYSVKSVVFGMFFVKHSVHVRHGYGMAFTGHNVYTVTTYLDLQPL